MLLWQHCYNGSISAKHISRPDNQFVSSGTHFKGHKIVHASSAYSNCNKKVALLMVVLLSDGFYLVDWSDGNRPLASTCLLMFSGRFWYLRLKEEQKTRCRIVHTGNRLTKCKLPDPVTCFHLLTWV